MPDGHFRLLPPPGAPALPGLDAYRQQGGYVALRRAVVEMAPAQVLGEIRAAGLRGRGGGGVLAAEKMALVAASPVTSRYVVCNAYDADPRSLISRTLLEREPHCLIEGMALAAWAVGASEGFLYVRAENRDAAKAAREALREAQEAGVLGGSVLGSRFAFSITLVGVDMGFMGGEESTLIQIIKGRPAKATQRPPYPTQYGVFDKPTLVQNAETLANIPAIVARGGGAFRSTGSEMSPGTKLVTVIGPDDRATLVEVPLGAPLGDVLKAAGLTATEDTARAIAVGGMEGGVLPLAQLSTAFDYEPLEDAGAIVGSSIVEVLPQDTCMVHWAMRRSDYLAGESCGKCVPCRVGVKRIAGTLEGIESGLGTDADLALLEEFSRYVPDGSLCGFGVNAVHPVVSAMRYFADDFRAHLDGTCPTGTCLPVRAHRYVTKHVL